jgi:hypothetical protein
MPNAAMPTEPPAEAAIWVWTRPPATSFSKPTDNTEGNRLGPKRVLSLA